MRMFACLLSLALLAGCKRKAPTSRLPDAGVLVEVNGKPLTWAKADEEVTHRMMGHQGRIPTNKIESARSRMRTYVVEQFVIRTLLLDEADRRHIQVAPEDETNAFAEIQAKLPPGKNLDEMMRNSPLGQERMREEVLVGIRVNKLLDSLGSNAVASAEEIAALRAEVPESVRARHILIKVDPKADDSVRQEKKARIDQIREQLLQGSNFAQMAREKSDCPSKIGGGDIGTFKRGRMAKAFEDAAFTQPVDEIGPVFATPFGYHIVQVLRHNKAGEMPEKQVLERIAERKRREALRSLLDDLRSRAKVVYAPHFVPSPAPPPPAPPSTTNAF